MYGRSDAFDAAVRVSHRPIFVADLMFGGDTILPNIPIAGGSVDVDGTAAVRRRCTLTVLDADGTLTPKVAADPLSPYGREIRVRRGIVFSNGTRELITIGTFRISTVDAGDTGTDRKISVTGFDRSRSVARARFETPYVIAAGTNYADAILSLLASRLPGVKSRFITTTRTTPLLVFDQGADPWATAQNMAASIGAELFFDPDGVCVLRTPTDPAVAAVDWHYDRGTDSNVTAASNGLSDEPGYNGVVVDGEPSDSPPVHAVVYDLNPASPTYANGPYGKVPRFYKSQYITTSQQAADAAAALFIQERGGTEQVKFTAIPHPAHEVNDLVHVKDDQNRIDDSYVLESFNMPLDLSLMQGTTRKRRTA